MANTYTKVYLHIIFAVKNRNALLHKSWRQDVFRYMTGILKRRGHFPLAVNGYVDHVHVFIDFNVNDTVSNLVRELKKATNKYIKEKGFCSFNFEWQSGYGVFSHGDSEKSKVINYIMNQASHHRTKTFREEYLGFLESYEIEFDPKYLFDFERL